MSNIKETEKSYINRLFEKSKNFIPKNNYPYFYLSSILPKDKSIKILDAGCGSGKYCSNLVEKGYINVFGLDLFDISKFKNANFKYVQGSIDDIAFEENYFDIVFANSVIMHLENPDTVFKEFQRILKPNGKVIVTGHTKNSLFTYWRKVKLFLNLKSVQNLKHAYFRKTKKYIDLLKNNNFEILKRDGFYLSFILYPFYLKKAGGLVENNGWKLPIIKPKMSKSRICAQFKSNHAYHFAIIARKK